MNAVRISIVRSGAAAALAGLLCAGAVAAPADAPQEPGGCAPGWRGPPRPPMGPGFSGGEDRTPPYLMGLRLSEDQEDKVFGILHAAAPELRERFKAARKARESLRELGHSAQYDPAKASSLAQALGAAEGQLALLRAHTDREIFLLLTPDQRTHLTEGPREGHPQGQEGPPR
jgi:periplasmic protein CpxP/Spy